MTRQHHFRPPISILRTYPNNHTNNRNNHTNSSIDGSINTIQTTKSSNTNNMLETTNTTSDSSRMSASSSNASSYYDYYYEDNSYVQNNNNHCNTTSAGSRTTTNSSNYSSASSESDYIFGSDNFGTFPTAYCVVSAPVTGNTKTAADMMNGTVNETFDSIDFGNDTINGGVASNPQDKTAIISTSKQNLSKSAITNIENLPTLQKSAMSAFLASPTQRRWSDLVRTLRVESRITSWGFTSLHDDMADSNGNNNNNGNDGKVENEDYANASDGFDEVRVGVDYFDDDGSGSSGSDTINEDQDGGYDNECNGGYDDDDNVINLAADGVNNEHSIWVNQEGTNNIDTATSFFAEEATSSLFVPSSSDSFPPTMPPLETAEDQEIEMNHDSMMCNTTDKVDATRSITIAADHNSMRQPYPRLDDNTGEEEHHHHQDTKVPLQVKFSMSAFMEAPTQSRWSDLVRSFREEKVRQSRNVSDDEGIDWHENKELTAVAVSTTTTTPVMTLTTPDSTNEEIVKDGDDTHETCEEGWVVSDWPTFDDRNNTITPCNTNQEITPPPLFAKEGLQLEQKFAMDAFMEQPSRDRWTKLVQSMREEKLRRMPVIVESKTSQSSRSSNRSSQSSSGGGMEDCDVNWCNDQPTTTTTTTTTHAPTAASVTPTAAISKNKPQRPIPILHEMSQNIDVQMQQRQYQHQMQQMQHQQQLQQQHQHQQFQQHQIQQQHQQQQQHRNPGKQRRQRRQRFSEDKAGAFPRKTCSTSTIGKSIDESIQLWEERIVNGSSTISSSARIQTNS